MKLYASNGARLTLQQLWEAHWPGLVALASIPLSPVLWALIRHYMLPEGDLISVSVLISAIASIIVAAVIAVIYLDD